MNALCSFGLSVLAFELAFLIQGIQLSCGCIFIKSFLIQNRFKFVISFLRMLTALL